MFSRCAITAIALTFRTRMVGQSADIDGDEVTGKRDAEDFDWAKYVEYTIASVTIQYTTAEGWKTPAECEDWHCLSGYELSDDGTYCVPL